MSARGELGTGTRRPSNDKRRTSSSVLQKQNSSKRATTTTTDDGKTSKAAKCTTCSFNRSDSPSSAIRYLKLLGGKMVAAFRMMSPKRSRKVTSSETTAKPPVPAPAPPALDSHRAEAIHDCIQFINSSSSLPRSNSVSYQG
nr:josephin-like protein [Ipomoea batatas]GMC83763.1 josephin-like protein [Ipomoea batatas]